MNAAVSVTNHPTDETLAAFVDGRLDAAAREEVIGHTVDCAECRDVVLTASEYAALETPSNVVRPPFWRRVGPPLAAVAAALVVVFVTPPLRNAVLQRSSMSDVAEVAESMKLRPSGARLSLNVPYKERKPVNRSGRNSEEQDHFAAIVAVNDAQAMVQKNPTSHNLHVLGLAHVFAGHRSDAVDALEKALAKAQTPSASLLSDLAAAYIAVGRYNEAEASARRSLEIERTPAALWNRALALRLLFRDAEAKAAWDEYLKIDPRSEWAEEVQREYLSD